MASLLKQLFTARLVDRRAEYLVRRPSTDNPKLKLSLLLEGRKDFLVNLHTWTQSAEDMPFHCPN